MKTWKGYLWLIGRFVRVLLAVAMTLSLCLMCATQVIWGLSKYEVFMSRTATSDGGNFRAIYISESRPVLTLGGGEDYLAMIVLGRGNERGPVDRIFVYEPTYENKYYEPRMKWLSPNHLEISIDKVNHIYSKKMKVMGVAISYCIGQIAKP